MGATSGLTPLERRRASAGRATRGPRSPTWRENIQARIRGNLMMALSNKHGWLVLTTGNKSEMSVGYATLYGDMAGGFAVIKDVPKTLVYELVRAPQRARRAPSWSRPRCSSARPRPSCAPTSSTATRCRPTTLLDRILEAYVERDQGREEMIAAGMPADVVDEVIRLVDRSEYKRRQAAPGIRITPQGLRPRPAPADHQPLRRLAALRRGLTAIVICAERAEPALVVEDFGVPDPGGAAAVAGRGLGVGVPCGDRAHEADADSTGPSPSSRRP